MDKMWILLHKIMHSLKQTTVHHYLGLLGLLLKLKVQISI